MTMLPSPFSKPRLPPPAPPPAPAPPPPSVDDQILKHLEHIDKILTAFYNVVLFSMVVAVLAGLWIVFGR